MYELFWCMLAWLLYVNYFIMAGLVVANYHVRIQVYPGYRLKFIMLESFQLFWKFSFYSPFMLKTITKSMYFDRIF